MRHRQSGRLLTGAAALVAGLFLVTACSGSGADTPDDTDQTAGSGELRTIHVSAPPSYNALTLHVAEAEGYFAEEGLKLEIVPTVGAEAVPQLLGGSLQFMLGDVVTLVRAQSEGVPLVIAAPSVLLDAPGDEAYSSVLIRTADAEKYTSAADIAGGSFGIPSVNSQPWLDVRTLVEEAGGDPDSIQFTEVPNPLQALRQGQVDFVTAPQPTVSAGVLEGDVTILTPLVLEDMGGIIGYPYLTTSDLVESDPALVQSFRRALIKANTLINSDRELALEVAATYLDVPEEVLQASTLPVLGEEMPTVEDMQKHIDRIVAAGIIAADDAPKAADLLAKQ